MVPFDLENQKSMVAWFYKSPWLNCPSIATFCNVKSMLNKSFPNESEGDPCLQDCLVIGYNPKVKKSFWARLYSVAGSLSMKT